MGSSRVIGFTPYARENLLTGHGRIRAAHQEAAFLFIMGGWEEGKRVKRQLEVTLYAAWIDYCDQPSMTHLWTVRDGRRRLVHRKK